MTKALKCFLQALTKDESLEGAIRREARQHLYEELKRKTRDVFEYFLERDIRKAKLKESIRNRDIVGIIGEVHYYDEAQKLFNENWQDIEAIIDILNEYIDELEKENTEEETNE